MKRFLLPTLACLALAAAGCGSDDDDGGSSGGGSTGTATSESPAPASGGKQIAMKNIQFDPKATEVKVGETVTWTNEDSVDHDVKAEEGASFQSETFGKGGTYEFKPDKAGTIKYVCTLHPGMDGELTVVP